MEQRPTPSSRVGAVQLPAFGERIFDARHLPPVVGDTKTGRSDEINPARGCHYKH